MTAVIEALPGQPLGIDDVGALNDTSTVRVIPYVWYGEQVFAIFFYHYQEPPAPDAERLELALTGERSRERLDSNSAADSASTAGATSEAGTAERKAPEESISLDQTRVALDETITELFGTHRPETLGTVEIIDDESLVSENQIRVRTRSDPETEDGTEAEDEAVSTDGADVAIAAYDDSEAVWYEIGSVDPMEDMDEADRLLREWLEETYHESMHSRFAVGPEEYEPPGDWVGE